MTTFLKQLFFMGTMLVWMFICTFFFMESLGEWFGATTKSPLRDFSAWFDWTMLCVSLACCTFSFYQILETAHTSKQQAKEQPTKTELLIKEMNDAIAREDYEKALEIRNKLRAKA